MRKDEYFFTTEHTEKATHRDHREVHCSFMSYRIAIYNSFIRIIVLIVEDI